VRTFNQFIKHACQCYDLDFESAKDIILSKLAKVRLSPIAVICYINWTGNEFLTEQQIAQHLNITQQGVQNHIQRLRKVWPHLPGKPKTYVNGIPLKVAADITGYKVPPMVRLTSDISNNTKIIATWGIHHFSNLTEHRHGNCDGYPDCPFCYEEVFGLGVGHSE